MNAEVVERRSGRAGSIASVAVLAFAGLVLFLKQTVPLVLIGARIGTRLPVVAAGLVLVELAPAVGGSVRSMALRVLTVDAVVTLITEADLVSFRINRRFLSVLSVSLAPYLSHLGGAISSAIHRTDALLVVDLAVLAASVAVLPAVKPARRTGQGRLLAGAGILTVCIATGTDPYWHTATVRNPATAGHASLVAFHVLETGEAGWTALRARLSGREQLSALQRWYAERRPREVAGNATPAAPRLENLLVVQLESLQAWTLGMRLSGRELTPTLNRLRDRGVSFENAFTQVGEGNTADAEWLTLCSQYPADAGVAFLRYDSSDLDCMPSLLRRHGFETLAFHGNDLSVYNRDAMYVTVGFTRRYGRGDLRADASRYEIPDRSLYAQIPALVPRGRPFALHVVSFSSHRPFHVPPQSLPLGKLEGTAAGEYLNAVHYADAALGELLESMRREGLLSRTLIVLYGDHGGINREDSGVADLPVAIPAHSRDWFIFERRIPLLFVGEGLAPARVTVPVGEIDVAPTIAGLLAVSTRHAGFLGRDLFRTEPRPVVFWAGSAMDGDHLYIEGGRRPQCFRVDGTDAPLSECGALAALGRRERENAQLALDGDEVASLDP